MEVNAFINFLCTCGVAGGVAAGSGSIGYGIAAFSLTLLAMPLLQRGGK